MHLPASGLDVSAVDILGQLDAVDGEIEGALKPALQLPDPVKQRMEPFLRLFRTTAGYDSLLKKTRKGTKCVVHRVCGNKDNQGQLPNNEACSFCQEHDWLCVVKEAEKRPVVVPRPRTHRQHLPDGLDSPDAWVLPPE